jgi:putative drug exporter of the RND superfamily
MSQVTVTGSPAVGTDRGRLAARVAGWSARHRMLALGGWLLLVAGVFLVGGQLGTKSLPSFDPGQAGQAERVLNRPDVFQRPAESVLIQARSAGQTVATDPELRQTTAEVMAALAALPGAAADIRSPQAGRGGMISADGRSELVSFTVGGPIGSTSQTVAADLRAVAA